MTLVRAWQRFWFPRVPVQRLAVFRYVMVTYVLYDLVIDPVGTRGLGSASSLFWNPNGLVLTRTLHAPQPNASAWRALWVVLLVAAVLSLIGLMTRLALIVLALGYGWWVMVSMAFSGLGHGRLLVVVSLAALAVGPAGAAFSVDGLIKRARLAQPGSPLHGAEMRDDPIAGWALRVVNVALVLAYMSAAYAKVRHSGVGWAFGGAFDAALLEQGGRIGRFVEQWPWFVHAIAVTAILWEAIAFVPLIHRRLRDIWCAVGVGFHTGSAVLLGVNFLDYVFAYTSYYDLEVGAKRIGVAARVRSGGSPRIQVIYDGQCAVCVRTATILSGLDWLGRLTFVDPMINGGRRPETFVAADAESLERGFEAYQRIARVIPALWFAVPFSYLPGFRQLGTYVYLRVAANRGPSCQGHGGPCQYESAVAQAVGLRSGRGSRSA